MSGVAVRVDGVPTELPLTGGVASPHCAGWTEHRGPLTPLAAYQVFRHVSGVVLVDVFNTRRDGGSVVFHVPDLAYTATIWPGAGIGYELVPPELAASGAGAPPCAHDVAYEKTILPDMVQVGETGSPRNSTVPKFHTALGVNQAQHALHAMRFAGFQLRRRYQRAGVDGRFVIGSYTENDPEPGAPSAKNWVREPFTIWSAKYGWQTRSLETWKATHLDVGELVAIFKALRDPRSLDQAKRLLESFLQWDWFCGVMSHAKTPYDENTRIKARCLEAIGRGLQLAQIAGDAALEQRLLEHADRHVDKISALWGSRLFPSVSKPSGTHLKDAPWDNTWMIGLLGWGAAIAMLRGVKKAKAIAERCADVLDEVLWDPKTDTFFQDLPIEPGAAAPTVYGAPGKPDFTGTLRWCSSVYFALERTSSPTFQRLLDGAAMSGKPIESPVSSTS